MKKKGITILAVLVLCCLLLSACSETYKLPKLGQVQAIEINDLIGGENVRFEKESNRMYLVFEAIDKSFQNDRNCDVEDGHVYQVILYDADNATEVIVNEDGSVCKHGKHFAAVEPVNIAFFSSLFPTAVTAEPDQHPYVPQNIERGTPTNLIETETYTYFYEHVKMDDKNYTILGRASAQRPIEVVLALDELYGNRHTHTIRYVENSLEQSGEKQLYFMVYDEDTNGQSLYSFALEEDIVQTVFKENCSDMVLLEDPPNAVKDYGWVISGDSIYAVTLTEGTVYEAMSKTAEQLEIANEINGRFFDDVATDKYDWKYSKLKPDPDDDNILVITVIAVKGGAESTLYEYRFDCETLKLEATI